MHESLCRPSHYAGYVAAKQKAKRILQSVHPRRQRQRRRGDDGSDDKLSCQLVTMSGGEKKRSLWNQRGQMRGSSADQCGTKTTVQQRDTISNAISPVMLPILGEWSFGVCCQAAHQRAHLFRMRSRSRTQCSEAPREWGRDHHLWMILIYLFCSTSQCVHKCPNEAN